MTPEDYDGQTAIDRLRRLVRRFDDNAEWFNDQYDLTDLLAIDRAWMLSEWDIYPDQWADFQVKDAVRGRAPIFDAQGRPVRHE